MTPIKLLDVVRVSQYSGIHLTYVRHRNPCATNYESLRENFGHISNVMITPLIRSWNTSGHQLKLRGISLLRNFMSLPVGSQSAALNSQNKMPRSSSAKSHRSPSLLLVSNLEQDHWYCCAGFNFLQHQSSYISALTIRIQFWISAQFGASVWRSHPPTRRSIGSSTRIYVAHLLLNMASQFESQIWLYGSFLRSTNAVPNPSNKWVAALTRRVPYTRRYAQHYKRKT